MNSLQDNAETLWREFKEQHAAPEGEGELLSTAYFQGNVKNELLMNASLLFLQRHLI